MYNLISDFSLQSWLSSEGLNNVFPLDTYYVSKLTEDLNIERFLSNDQCHINTTNSWTTGQFSFNSSPFILYHALLELNFINNLQSTDLLQVTVVTDKM